LFQNPPVPGNLSTIVIETAGLRATIAPADGGKIWSALDAEGTAPPFRRALLCVGNLISR
jgi:hypothetical protein